VAGDVITAGPPGPDGAPRTTTPAVRRRLARLGAQRGATVNAVLEPLIKTVRNTHPKADVRLIERSYDVAAYWHRDQKR
jgi:guanosine-3',5'-bis(diphosphate) 3'-pyrophosphohydrolase